MSSATRNIKCELLHSLFGLDEETADHDALFFLIVIPSLYSVPSLLLCMSPHHRCRGR